MRQWQSGTAGSMHVGLLSNDRWLQDHDAPLASVRHAGSDIPFRTLVARGTIESRTPPPRPRTPMPFDTFVMASGGYEDRYGRRARAVIAADELRERYGLTERPAS